MNSAVAKRQVDLRDQNVLISNTEPRLACYVAPDIFCVCRNDNYNSFPDLVRADSGALVCAWRPGDGHRPKKYSAIAVSVSNDEGCSWSAPNIIESSEDIGVITWDCPSLSVLKDGRLAMVANAITGRNTEDENIEGDIELYLWFSSDHGHTWSKRHKLPFDGMCPGKLLPLIDGAWLVTAHKRTPVGGENRLVQYAWRSLDEGLTWSEPFIMASDSGYNMCEASVVELGDGTLVAYIREDSRKGIPMFKSISYDGGKTWSFSRTNIAAGHRPRAGLLENGKIFVSYRLYHHCMPIGGNTFAYVESERSARESDWQKQYGRAFPLVSDSSVLADGGYTGWVQNEDRTITLVNYGCGSHPVPWIYGINFDPQGFCDSLGQ